MEPRITASILISTHNRLPLWKRTLWWLARNWPRDFSCEVVVVDDGSTEDVLGELRKYSSQFFWTFVRLDMVAFEKETGLGKFMNNPSLSFNVAARHARGAWLYQNGNEVISWDNVYDRLMQECPKEEFSLTFSTTLDVPPEVLLNLNEYGTNLTPQMVEYCQRWPLANPLFHTDVTNYVSLCSRSLYHKLGGYDERYLGGIGKEDSDFVRRCRAIPGWADGRNMCRSHALSLHQSHGGRTLYYRQTAATASDEKWREGERRSKAVWDSWDGSFENRQPWPWGELGVADVVSN